MLAWLTAHWRVPLFILAAPPLLWLLALAGWLLLMVLGALYHAVMLMWAFLTLVVVK